jgi:hypothetical protein
MAAGRRRSIVGRGWFTTTGEDATQMEASELDVLGPVDYLVVEFPADRANFSGEMAANCDRWSTVSSFACSIS